MTEDIRITFQPSGRSVHVLPGTILLEAAARAGYVIETPCGGMGSCGKCIVRIADGDCPAGEHGCQTLSEEQLREGYRLACSCRVRGPLTVEIPESSLFQAGHKILESSVQSPLELKPEIDEIRDLLPAQTVPHGMAFDIGTTTLVGTLVNLETGSPCAVTSMINPQTSYGDDVVARIRKCREESDGLAVLHGAVIEAANELIREACEEADLSREHIVKLAISGNTTMQQIFCNIDPRALGEIPFEPAFRDMLTLQASEVGLQVHPAASLIVFPQIGGFVGGDTVAGILATDMDRRSGPVLLVDVGTNGEIVLAYDGKLTATSVAAGPAFEGARIHHGMRATRGAIEKVVLNHDVEINVIGNAAPSGICGTGLIDGVAALLRSGILDETGRILGPDELPDDLSPALAARVVANDGQYDFILAHGELTASGEPVCLYQRDIRELQLANGAIRAGISILLQMAGLSADDLEEVLLAGAFGNFIRRSNAARIGMLPAIPHERIRFVGNTASFGALRALLSTDEAARAQAIMAGTEHLDLSQRPDFQMEFAGAMMFPEK